ncbi:hypothetical protein F66182_3737 [Fusarium sp. NRRL 66182]|nr:hypothetical protein F66182_3737 [Fusarium sp. NRRL 66182]
MLFRKHSKLLVAVISFAAHSSCDTLVERNTESSSELDEIPASNKPPTLDSEANLEAVKVPSANNAEEKLDQIRLASSHTQTFIWFTDKPPRATVSVPFVSITLTKPLAPWTTLARSDENSDFPWMSEWTTSFLDATTIETATADETTSSATSEETESSKTAGKSPFSGGKIAGIVLGALAGLFILILVTYMAVIYRKRRTERRKPQRPEIRIIGRPVPDPTMRGSQSYFSVSTPNDSRELVSWLPGRYWACGPRARSPESGA